MLIHGPLTQDTLPNAESYVLLYDAALPESFMAPIRAVLCHRPCIEKALQAGETLKTLPQLAAITEWMSEQQVSRQAHLVAVGGGSLLDFAGFVASVYHRGIAHSFMPTTTLAMIDAAIGGKTALNLPQAKNVIGTFYEPHALFYDLQSLDSLDSRHLRAGLVEAIKIAIAFDADFFEWIWTHQTTLHTTHLEGLIVRSRDLKQKVVAADFKEQGQRALLNLGHTFGHAIEAALGFDTVLHGEAVAIGLALAAELSCSSGDLSQQDFNRILMVLTTLGVPTTLPPPLSLSSLIPFMMRDKKNKNHAITLILLNFIGQAKAVSVPPSSLQGSPCDRRNPS